MSTDMNCLHSDDSLHWSLIVICHPGEVARLEGMLLFFWNLLPLFENLPCINFLIIFQMKTWTSQLKYHVYCIWILLKEVIRVSKILFKGILELLKFICFWFLTDLACYFEECATLYEIISSLLCLAVLAYILFSLYVELGL